ncbi:hypothetical protein [Psychrobacillus vulpis]|uniref:Uncharacterized protein n=1 Tax=Psychrobacillus vulpis TaxID=2325572 RepID=A0A544TR49_9BACI|nr:hypothetical protein [Psychrobacillus vulpis]TQR19934.1 hypothetical protein FG384_09735 [Psychrobacillus vulpis]
MSELQLSGSASLTVKENISSYETSLKSFLEFNNLPTENVLTAVPQRIVVFSNVDNALINLPTEVKSTSNYISKFIAASSAGLFDAALNYLWNETIQELRRRVAQYDLGYFYDTAVASPEKRKSLVDEEDLEKLSDAELIYGAKEIGLISDVGFQHLDYIKYMRNWGSAAHPNQVEITGLQLISWLETCINEVISLPLSNVTLEIRKLLSNVKTNTLTADNAKVIGTFFDTLTNDQINNLLSGFFGIYTRKSTSEQVRDNIKLILPYLWGFTNEEQRHTIGIKYGKYSVNNFVEEEKLAREFLEIVEGQSYIPEKIRATEIDTALDELLIAHRGLNNFYSEPAFAREMKRLIGEGEIPDTIKNKYIESLVEVFLSNGSGITWNAEPVYQELLAKFNNEMALKAILTIFDKRIKALISNSRLRKDQYFKMVSLLKAKVTSKSAQELIDLILEFTGPIDKIELDAKFKRLSEPLLKLL